MHQKQLNRFAQSLGVCNARASYPDIEVFMGGIDRGKFKEIMTLGVNIFSCKQNIIKHVMMLLNRDNQFLLNCFTGFSRRSFIQTKSILDFSNENALKINAVNYDSLYYTNLISEKHYLYNAQKNINYSLLFFKVVIFYNKVIRKVLIRLLFLSLYGCKKKVKN